ncbi:MAG: S8 family serine peptidase [Planctomycetota bacterium]
MGRICFHAAVAAIAALSFQASAIASPNYAPGRIVIQLVDSADDLPALTPEDGHEFPLAVRAPQHRVMTSLLAVGATSVRPAFGQLSRPLLASSLGLDRFYLVELDPELDTQQAVLQLQGLGDIQLAEPVAIGYAAAGPFDQSLPSDGTHARTPASDTDDGRPNDSDYGLQYAIENVGQDIPGDIFRPGGPGTPDADTDLVEAWQLHTCGPETIIAIVDTGVSSSHPDLAPARIDGFDYFGNDGDPDDSVIRSHGTHVAGIAAAIGNNDVGVIGAAHGASIMPLRALDALGAGDAFVATSCIVHAVENGADVINLSLGFRAESQLLHTAVRYAHASGVVLVAAAGNNPTRPIPVPASYAEVIAVGATNHFDEWANFSSQGPELSITAPGYNIWTCQDTQFDPDGYDFDSGTSFSCALVSGIAALVTSANPELSPSQVRSLLEATADDLGEPGRDDLFGAGRVNARSAIELALDAVPCSRADVSTTETDGVPDGAVNENDFIYFLDAWFRRTPAADIAGRAADLPPDGRVTLMDFATYVSLWVGGCDEPAAPVALPAG